MAVTGGTAEVPQVNALVRAPYADAFVVEERAEDESSAWGVLDAGQLCVVR